MNLSLTQKVHGQIFNGIGQILQGAVGTMGGGNNHFGLLFGQLLAQFFLKVGFVFFFGRQVSLHGTHKGPGTESQGLEIIFTLFGTDPIHVIVGIGHAIQITSAVNVGSPVFPSFVPTTIGSVGTKDQQQSQGGTGQGEGRQGQGEFGQELTVDNGLMRNAFKVRVSTHIGIPHDNKGRHCHGGGDFAQQVAVNTGFENGPHVKKESIRRPMFLPIIMTVHGTSIFTTGFSVGHLLGWIDATETIPSGGIVNGIQFGTGRNHSRGGNHGPSHTGSKGVRTRRQGGESKE
mmetsp:Transcript_1241/g.2724  ORF Transcript_1241/g.2724 Transcript_1241/m.2724 type:complete len:289 (-) Transcript_1241:112-978(-)